MSIAMTAVDPQALRRTFGHYPSGVVALGALVDGEVELLVASSFTVGVSLEPPLVMFAVQHSSTTWPRLAQAKTLGVSIFGSDQGDLCRQLAAKDRDERLRGVPLGLGASGAVHVEGAAGRLECRIYETHPAGDHDIVVLEVLDATVDHDHDPLVFHGSRFRPLS